MAGARVVGVEEAGTGQLIDQEIRVGPKVEVPASSHRTRSKADFDFDLAAPHIQHGTAVESVCSDSLAAAGRESGLGVYFVALRSWLLSRRSRLVELFLVGRLVVDPSSLAPALSMSSTCPPYYVGLFRRPGCRLP